MTIELLSWNVAGRVRRLPEQADRIIAVAPDVVCLQEVTRSTAVTWTQLLSAAGWTHVATADTERALAEGRRRPLATLTAARSPLAVVEVAGAPWAERVLATRIEHLHVVNVHSPISPSPGLAKVRTHEAVYAHLLATAGRRLVCGDLNTPRKEHPDGRVWTFARTHHGKLLPDRGERWDQAELALIKGLEPSGFRDAFRELHGPQARELSWEWPRWGGGYRLDHLVLSPGITISELTYLHQWRHDGLSDHSPLLARIA
jgi:exodeoxyribonuclease III